MPAKVIIPVKKAPTKVKKAPTKVKKAPTKVKKAALLNTELQRLVGQLNKRLVLLSTPLSAESGLYETYWPVPEDAPLTKLYKTTLPVNVTLCTPHATEWNGKPGKKTLLVPAGTTVHDLLSKHICTLFGADGDVDNNGRFTPNAQGYIRVHQDDLLYSDLKLDGTTLTVNAGR